MSPTPYRFNESRRHKIPAARCRATNWPEHDATLTRRGGLAVWTTEAAVAAWQAPPTGERGGQPTSSAIAIETCLALRLVFHQPPRRTEGLVGSTAELLEAAAVPSETTVTRRDHRVAEIAKHGRIGWQRRSGYNRRGLAETTTCRCRAIAGRRLHARTLPNQQVEAKIGRNVLNRVAGIGMPASARVR